ncbi:hypothetical protein PARMER_00025 [Parabacteroides merdae ATCC 43184]|nr:hypothetical protein PARMER_00025 [Parabacteroides merdae ATCC 43184]
MICRFVGEKQMKCFTLLNKKDYSSVFSTFAIGLWCNRICFR